MLFRDLLSDDTLATSYLACLIYNYDGLVDRDQTLRAPKEPSLDNRSAQRSLDRIMA